MGMFIQQVTPNRHMEKITDNEHYYSKRQRFITKGNYPEWQSQDTGITKQDWR